MCSSDLLNVILKTIPDSISLIFNNLMPTQSTSFTESLIIDAARLNVYSLPTCFFAISILLAFFNMLPFPPLDFGKLLLSITHRIAHRYNFSLKVIKMVESFLCVLGVFLLFGSFIIRELRDVITSPSSLLVWFVVTSTVIFIYRTHRKSVDKP